MSGLVGGLVILPGLVGGLVIVSGLVWWFGHCFRFGIVVRSFARFGIVGWSLCQVWYGELVIVSGLVW